MKRITSLALVAVLLGWALSSSGADPKPRVFGPEWTKVGDKYVRKAEVMWTNPGSNVSSCALPLLHETLRVIEADDHRWFKTSVDNCGGWEVSQTDKGEVAMFKVVLKEHLYFDIDGDGVIDAFYDGRAKHKTFWILFDGRYVQTEDRLSAFTGGPGEKIQEWGYGRKERYEFDGGKWKLLTPPAAQ